MWILHRCSTDGIQNGSSRLNAYKNKCFLLSVEYVEFPLDFWTSVTPNIFYPDEGPEQVRSVVKIWNEPAVLTIVTPSYYEDLSYDS